MDYLRTAIEFATSCCSNQASARSGEVNERTHLLVDPVSNSPAVRRTNSEDYINDYPNSLPKRDEQTALSRIISETATNIIDVSAMDAHSLEPQEYNDRVKLYNHRLAQQWSQVSHPSPQHYSGFLKDIPNPDLMLTSKPISADDLQMIKSFVKEAAQAINDIKIEHTEDLIVPFQIISS